jgi:hypothetical protein
MFNNVFSQSNWKHDLPPDFDVKTSFDNLPSELQERANNERENKINEHYVKTKYDSMCGQPAKIKFQFYNFNAIKSAGNDL